jgi:hypothetical protein
MIPSFSESRRRAPRGLAGMLVLVALCESYIAGNDLKFSRLEAEDWKSTARIARGGLPPGGVFFFGDSQVKFGVSPLLLESKLGQPSHCLALQGGQAPSSYFLLRKTLEAGVIPSALVVDFEPHLLREGIDHNRRMWPELADLGECLELAWDAGDADAFASMALGRLLPSYRERSEIRENIKAALRGETPFMASWLEMAVRNKGMNRGALAMAKQSHGVVDVAPWANPTPKRWEPDRVNDLYARKFLELAARNQIPVYCLLMPVAPAMQDKMERNGMDRPHLAWLRRLQKRFQNLYVLDWRHANYQDPVFTDALHLDAEGAASITSSIGDYLGRCFRGEGVDVRWVQMPPFRADGVAVAVEDSNRSHAFMQSTAKRRR